jgi:hypothetical protein
MTGGRSVLYGICSAACAFLFAACTTGVEPSPHPGVLRVTLKSDDLDTNIVILSDTTRFSRYDAFQAWMYSGRIYRGDNYSDLFVNTSIARISSDTVNLLAREWLTGVPINIRDSVVITAANSRYRKFVIFEWVVPPGTYDLLQFSLMASEIDTYIPKLYINPLLLPPGVGPQVYFPVSFTVQDDRVTQIDLTIAPFKSLHRYQDSFLFDRQMKVAGITTY